MTDLDKMRWVVERAVRFGDPLSALSMAHRHLGMTRWEYYELVDRDDFKELYRKAVNGEVMVPLMGRLKRGQMRRALMGDVESERAVRQLPYAEVRELEERREFDAVGRLSALVRKVVVGGDQARLVDGE